MAIVSLPLSQQYEKKEVNQRFVFTLPFGYLLH